MPASDYTSTVSGGLKLKGGAKDSGIKKKKKSSGKKKEKSAAETTTTTKDEGDRSEETKPPAESSSRSKSALALARQAQDEDDEEEEQAQRSRSRSRSGSAVPANNMNTVGTGKTEAQRRHEEIKRKRVKSNHRQLALSACEHCWLTLSSSQLDERLRREGGAKTHKQRVEELNKYLSTLSEHHDMPRIGPG